MMIAHAEITGFSLNSKTRVLEISKALTELEIEHTVHYTAISVNGVTYQGHRQLNVLAQLIEQGNL